MPEVVRVQVQGGDEAAAGGAKGDGGGQGTGVSYRSSPRLLLHHACLGRAKHNLHETIRETQNVISSAGCGVRRTGPAGAGPEVLCAGGHFLCEHAKASTRCPTIMMMGPSTSPSQQASPVGPADPRPHTLQAQVCNRARPWGCQARTM
jgi:hypothetical protein